MPGCHFFCRPAVYLLIESIQILLSALPVNRADASLLLTLVSSIFRVVMNPMQVSQPFRQRYLHGIPHHFETDFEVTMPNAGAHSAYTATRALASDNE